MGHYKQNEMKNKDAARQAPKDRPPKVELPPYLKHGEPYKGHCVNKEVIRYWAKFSEKGYY